MPQIGETEDYIIETDTEYIEEYIDSILQIEATSILNIDKFSESELKPKGRGLIITLSDGKKYELAINGIY